MLWYGIREMSDWSSMTWLCIDTETTGVDPIRDRVVELAAVQFRGGEVQRRMGMLIQPGVPIPEEATAVHGIRDEDVAGSPTLAQVQERFLAHVRAAEVLVGYNWPFDAAFLEAAMGEGWREAIEGKPVIDALVVVRFDQVGRYWKGAGRHKLESAARQLGVEWEGRAHRASADCVVTCRVLWKLREHLPSDPRQADALVRSERERQQKAFEAWRSAHPRDDATSP